MAFSACVLSTPVLGLKQTSVQWTWTDQYKNWDGALNFDDWIGIGIYFDSKLPKPTRGRKIERIFSSYRRFLLLSLPEQGLKHT